MHLESLKDGIRPLFELILIIAAAQLAAAWIVHAHAPTGPGQTLDAIELGLGLAAPLVLWRMAAHMRIGPRSGRQPLALLRAAAVTLTVAGFGLTAVIADRDRDRMTALAEQRFDRITDRLSHDLEERLTSPDGVLIAARAHLLDAPPTDAESFDRYVASLELSTRAPAVVGMKFIQRIPANPEAPDAASADDRYVVQFASPPRHAEIVRGADVTADPIRHAAILKAVDHNTTIATSTVGLLERDAPDEPARLGLVYMLPVHDPAGRTIGLLAAAVVLDRLLSGIEESAFGAVRLRILEGDARQNPGRRLDGPATLARLPELADDLAAATALFRRTSVLDIAGRQWTFTARTTPEFEGRIGMSSPIILLAAGGLLSIMLGQTVWLLGSARLRAADLALAITARLRDASRTNERLAEIARRTSNAVVITDPHGRVEWINAGFERLTGYTLEELRGLTPGSVLRGPDTDPAEARRIKAALIAGQAVRGELVNYSKTGQRYTVSLDIAPLHDDRGNLTGFMSIESDVTAIRAVERRNQERELLLREMEEAGAIGGWALDVATGRLEWTDHTRRIHGVGPDYSPTLENALNFYPEPVRPRVRQAVQDAVAKGQGWEFEEPFIKATGERIWVRAIGRVQTRNGKVHRLYGAVQDITASKARESELAAAREAAEAANRAKSAFLANMSHEIRTPLTAVLGFSEILLDSLPAADTTQQEIVRGIQRAGSHLLTVINDVLDLSKIEAERMTVEDVPTPIAGLLDEAVDLLRPRARQKGLDLAVTLLTPLPENILSDPTRIRQIVINLLGNALKFTENGRVDLRAAVVGEPDAQRLQIEVEDQGPGMTAEQAARLFNAFTQADATVTRKHGGTGLGLMISRKLAELLGGDLSLARTAPGQGACFRLTLPLRIAPGSAMVHTARSPAPAAAGSAPAAQPLTGRILLAEDGPDNQRIIAHHLRRAGATVDIVCNGVEALAAIRRARASPTPYDLLITDMQMPEMDGYTLAAELRAAGEWLPIIALTAHAMADDRDRCLRAGCNDYASKPIDRERLLAACRRWLGVRGAGNNRTAA